MRLIRLTALLLAAGASPLSATMTKPGPFNVGMPGTTVAAQPELAGTVVSDQVIPFSTGGPNATQNAHGTVQVRVSKGADGSLSFEWRVVVAPDSKQSIVRVMIENFPAGVYDANWRIDGLGDSAPDGLEGGTWGGEPYHFLFFFQGIAPGHGSRFFFLKTRAKAFAGKGVDIHLVTDKAQADTIPAKGPSYPVPGRSAPPGASGGR